MIESQLYQVSSQSEIRQPVQNRLKASNNNLNADLCAICMGRPITKHLACMFVCGHNLFCLSCLNKHVRQEINAKRMPKCPLQGCEGLLKNEDKSAISPLDVDIKVKISELVSQNMEGLSFCRQVDCRGWIKNGTCCLCLTNYCQNCIKCEHFGQCIISDISRSQNFKRCPNCRMGISRQGGCFEITCPNCRHRFCYSCLQEWSSMHHACQGRTSITQGIMAWIYQIFR